MTTTETLIEKEMEARTKEQLAGMSHEELEVLVLHHQDEEQGLRALLNHTEEMKMYYFTKLNEMEARMDVLLRLLKSWGVDK